MKILFMGTPDFAAVTLRALCEDGTYEIVGAVTQPDKPKGRGYVMTPPAVKVCAGEFGVPVYQPETLRGGAFADTLSEIDPDLIVVAAYGKILPSYVLDYPKYGCLNIHGSLLPRYRGAAPIQRAVIEGESVTGVTVMRMEAGLDTGDMYVTAEVPITEEDNFETVHDKLAAAGARLLLESLPGIVSGEIEPKAQDDSLSTYAAKIEKEDCILHFSDPAKALSCRIRGLSPFPLAVCRLRGKLLKITDARPFMGSGAPCEGSGMPGEVIALTDDAIVVACGDGAIAVTGVLPEGKRRMSAADFIRGRGVAVGDVLEEESL